MYLKERQIIVQNQLNIYKNQISSLEKEKNKGLIYKDPEGKFYINIPYGYDVKKDGKHGAFILLKGSDVIFGQNIFFSYLNYTDYFKETGDKDRLRNKNESFVDYMKRQATIHHSWMPIKPTFSDVSYGNYQAVLEICVHRAVLSRGIFCNGNGDDSYFWKILTVADGEKGEFRFHIQAKRGTKYENIDLTQWIDRVHFANN